MSLINAKILKFYREDSHIEFYHFDRFFNAKNDLNFVEILKYLEGHNLEDFDLATYEDFLHVNEKLLPLYIQSSKVIQKNKEPFYCLDWLGKNYEYAKKTIWSFGKNDVQTIEHILLMTSLFENALGNIFRLQSNEKRPPHLLKDLLATKEVKKVFGHGTIIFVQIILGSPKSINLRNIVWHGFPKSNEIPKYYEAILILCLHSMGLKLKEQNFQIENLFLKSDIHLMAEGVIHVIPLPNGGNLLKDLDNNFLASSILPNGFTDFWIVLKEYYKKEQFWEFVLLILPQIELLLRLHYAKANKFDITAKLDEYYITMDTIFDKNVPLNDTKDNSLLSFEAGLSEASLKFMYDLFVAPQGLRLRDKVSHGEIDFVSLNNRNVCDLLLLLALELLKHDDSTYIPLNYESQFHLNSITLSALTLLKSKFSSFILEHLPEAIRDLGSLQFQNCSSLKIFLRPKKEAEFMLLIQRISILLSKTLDNYDESIKFKQKLHKDYELHSKRRKTLRKLLDLLPIMVNTIQELFLFLENLFLQLQKDEETIFGNDSLLPKYIKFLKSCLKMAENFSKYSHKDSNEWIKCSEICQKFINLKSGFYKELMNVR